MNKESFFDEVSKEFNINSKTFKYRYSKFMEACDINFDNVLLTKSYGDNGLPYFNLKQDNGNINLCINYSFNQGINTLLIGEYNDLNFIFTNNHNHDKRNIINELPFDIKLNKFYQDTYYNLEIYSESNTLVKFVLNKYDNIQEKPSELVFFATIMDFGEILRLVKSFVINPNQLFNNYYDIFKQKKWIFNNIDITKSIVKDDNLDEPVNGIKKVIRKLFK